VTLQAAISRIIAALKFKVARQIRAPVIEEREFIEITVNHGQYCKRLLALGHVTASQEVRKNAFHVGLCWMNLAREHLEDARAALTTNKSRMIFSRSYYAVYNASKAVRYIVNGVVSLKGDDHQRTSDLPDDFPQVEMWSETIPKLYQHRLLADYDNWRATASQFSLTPEEAVEQAGNFVAASQAYLNEKIGVMS
jgi:HEPN domain-containing protein